MYILLQKGMKIKAGDEYYHAGMWKVNYINIDTELTIHHTHHRRKITTIKELAEALGEGK